MGKGTAVAIAIFGIIIFLLGLAMVEGIIASNMILLLAGPFLIVAVMLMAIGVYLMHNAKKRWERATVKKWSGLDWDDEPKSKIRYIKEKDFWD